MIRSAEQRFSILRSGTLTLLSVLFLVPSVHARSLEEALDELGSRLGRQLGEQQVRSFGALQFVNLDGAQSRREEQLADGLARRISRSGSRASYIGLTPSEAARAKFGLSPGANIAGETAARIAKLAGTDAMMIGTLRRIDSETHELIGQIFSAQRGINLADARVTYNQTATAPPPVQPPPPTYAAPPAPVQPAPPAPSAAPEIMTTEAGQFLIELHGCRRISAGVNCSFVLKNQSANANLTIWNGGTRLFDDQGREYEPGVTVIADARQDLKGSGRRRIQKQVIGGVPTKASIRFPNVQADAQSIASLQLNLYAPKSAKAEFRSVPILGAGPQASSTPLGAPGRGTPGGSATSANQQAEAGQFLIELTGCHRKQSGVNCSLTLVNQGANAKFTIWNGSTRLFDDQGREYEPGVTVIADARVDLKGSGRRRIEKQMIGGVPLQLNLYAPKAAKAEFRNIPILTR